MKQQLNLTKGLVMGIIIGVIGVFSIGALSNNNLNPFEDNSTENQIDTLEKDIAKVDLDTVEDIEKFEDAVEDAKKEVVERTKEEENISEDDFDRPDGSTCEPGVAFDKASGKCFVIADPNSIDPSILFGNTYTNPEFPNFKLPYFEGWEFETEVTDPVLSTIVTATKGAYSIEFNFVTGIGDIPDYSCINVDSSRYTRVGRLAQIRESLFSFRYIEGSTLTIQGEEGFERALQTVIDKANDPNEQLISATVEPDANICLVSSSPLLETENANGSGQALIIKSYIGFQNNPSLEEATQATGEAAEMLRNLEY